MAARPGSDNPLSGPRLPRPAGPFCAICQDHERPGNKVHVGNWGLIRLNLPLPLCERCINERRPRLDPDPLTLDDVA